MLHICIELIFALKLLERQPTCLSQQKKFVKLDVTLNRLSIFCQSYSYQLKKLFKIVSNSPVSCKKRKINS